MVNTFEHVADEVYPGHAERRRALAAAVGGSAHLSGAGPSLFAVVGSRDEGERAVRSAARRRVRGAAGADCRGLLETPPRNLNSPTSPILQAAMAEFITYRRWTLRDGREESELVELVREEIVPHYKKLQGCLGLGLLRIEGTRSYLALQHWESRELWRKTVGSDYYKTWYEEYVPILDRWNKLMIFEDEWDAEDVLGTSAWRTHNAAR